MSGPILIDFRLRPDLNCVDSIARKCYESFPSVKKSGHKYFDHHWVQWENGQSICIADVSMKGDLVVSLEQI